VIQHMLGAVPPHRRQDRARRRRQERHRGPAQRLSEPEGAREGRPAPGVV